MRPPGQTEAPVLCRTAGQKQDEITILYGGSVNTSNAKQILQLESISGLLIGGASLDEKQFLEIIG